MTFSSNPSIGMMQLNPVMQPCKCFNPRCSFQTIDSSERSESCPASSSISFRHISTTLAQAQLVSTGGRPTSRWLCRSLGDPQQCAWRRHAQESWQAVDGPLWKPKSSRKFSQIMLCRCGHHGHLTLCVSKIVSKTMP